MAILMDQDLRVNAGKLFGFFYTKHIFIQNLKCRSVASAQYCQNYYTINNEIPDWNPFENLTRQNHRQNFGRFKGRDVRTLFKFFLLGIIMDRIRMDMTFHYLSFYWLTRKYSNQPELSMRKLKQ